MLACAADDLNKLTYPLYGSKKLDGIRASTYADECPAASLALSRSLKPIQNTHIRNHLITLRPGFTGEIGTLNDQGAVDFRTTTGNVMRESGEPNFKFFIFDDWLHPGPFKERYASLLKENLPPWAVVLEQKLLQNADEITAMFAEVLAGGDEGVILRDPAGKYKHGRSTLGEQGMLKVKPWKDTEAIIVDVVEEMHNGNEAVTNELGRTARSSAKAGKTGKGSLGALVVRHPDFAATFEIGTGFTAADRAALWAEKPTGKLAKFKYVTVGGYDVPRHTVFLGLRDKDDLDA